MLFSPRSVARNWLLDSNNLFSKLLSLAILGHMLLVLSLFLADKLGMQSITVSMKGARVSMLPGAKGAAASALPSGVSAVQNNAGSSIQKQTEEPLPAKVKAATETKNDLNEVKLEKKAKEEKTKKPSMSELNKNRIPELQKASKKEEVKKAELKTKEEKPTPEFSKLKKEFSKLNKKKSEQSDARDTKKKLSSVDDVEKKVSEIAPKNTAASSNINNVKINGAVAAGAGAPVNGNSSLNSYPVGGPVETEMGEFVGDDAAGYHDEFRQELAKYLRIPPGFEHHEPLNISWDVQDGVVVYVSPQGSEPLLLYAAYKDAILKCNYPRLKYRKKYVYTFA